MADNASKDAQQAAEQLIETLGENQQSAMDAVRSFVDTVDGAFPDVGEDGPRGEIIDAAFKMSEQIVSASNRLALNIVQAAGSAVDDLAAKASDETE